MPQVEISLKAPKMIGPALVMILPKGHHFLTK